jgi:3-isopropylmalate dehydrogenase
MASQQTVDVPVSRRDPGTCLQFNIAVLPGDGIGAEVIPQAVRVLDALSEPTGLEFSFQELSVGGASVDSHGAPITEETVRACLDSDAVLLGAVGGPQWDHLPLKQRPETSLLTLRRSLDCYANLRPIWLPPCLAERTPLRLDLVAPGIDIVIVRELMHGLYYGERGRRTRSDGVVEAFDTAIYTREAVRRVADLAFRLARRRRGRVMSLDKSNILETSRLWREVVDEVWGGFAISNCAISSSTRERWSCSSSRRASTSS